MGLGLVGRAGADGGAAQAIGNRAPPRTAGQRFDQDEVGADGVEHTQAGVEALGVGGGLRWQSVPSQAGVTWIEGGVGEHGDAAALARQRGGLVGEQRGFDQAQRGARGVMGGERAGDAGRGLR